MGSLHQGSRDLDEIYKNICDMGRISKIMGYLYGTQNRNFQNGDRFISKDNYTVGVFGGLFRSFFGIPTNPRIGITFSFIRLGSEIGGPKVVFPGYHIHRFIKRRLEGEGFVGGTRTYNKHIGHDMGY